MGRGLTLNVRETFYEYNEINLNRDYTLEFEGEKE